MDDLLHSEDGSKSKNLSSDFDRQISQGSPQEKDPLELQDSALWNKIPETAHISLNNDARKHYIKLQRERARGRCVQIQKWF